jgi:hypothetical protein
MMFNWEFSDWIVFFVDIIALAIVIRFLSWKVKHKLDEVEQRQKFETDRKSVV